MRRSCRSTSAPANRPNAISGIACASPTAPVQIALPVAVHTWYSTATSVIWAPRPEKVCPIHNRR
jgi:hypothetical protein